MMKFRALLPSNSRQVVHIAKTRSYSRPLARLGGADDASVAKSLEASCGTLLLTVSLR